MEKQAGDSWAGFFIPALCAALSIPLFMMDGTFRPIVGGVLILSAIVILVKQRRAAG